VYNKTIKIVNPGEELACKWIRILCLPGIFKYDFGSELRTSPLQIREKLSILILFHLRILPVWMH